MLKKDGKPTTFGPGYFKRTPEKSGLGPEWDRILEDRRNAYRIAAQLQEINRRRQIAELKKAAGSPWQNALSQGGNILVNALMNRGGDWASSKIFGGETKASTGGSGQGLLDKLFGSWGSSGPALPDVNTSMPMGPYNFSSGPSGITGIPGLDTEIPLQPSSAGTPLVPEGQGFFSNFSNLFKGGSDVPSSSTLSSEGASSLPSLSQIGGAAATAKGIYDSYNAYKNKGKGIRTGLAEIGGGIGTLMAGPVGGAVGTVGGSVLGYGLQHPRTAKGMLALLATAPAALPIGLFGGGFLGDDNKWDTERKRLRALKDKGANVPQSLIDDAPTRGRSIDELLNSNYANDYIGVGKNNEWVNNRFAQSRDVKDLRPEDVLNYSAFAEKTPGWFDASLEQRKQIAKYALDNGLVNEGRGTIDLSQSPDYDTYVKQILGL